MSTATTIVTDAQREISSLRSLYNRLLDALSQVEQSRDLLQRQFMNSRGLDVMASLEVIELDLIIAHRRAEIKHVDAQIQAIAFPNPGTIACNHEVVSRMCMIAGFEYHKIVSENRGVRDVTEQRFMMVKFLRNSTCASYFQIGRHLGGRDHATIIKCELRCNELISIDDKFSEKYNELEQKWNKQLK